MYLMGNREKDKPLGPSDGGEEYVHAQWPRNSATGEEVKGVKTPPPLEEVF